MFGYACRETPELMPLPVSLAHRIARALDRARPALPWLSPDGKTQVSIEYRDGRPARIHAIALTAAVAADAPIRQVDEGLRAVVTRTFEDDERAARRPDGDPYQCRRPV